MPHCHAFAQFLGAGMNIDEGMAMSADVDMDVIEVDVGMVGVDGCRGWG